MKLILLYSCFLSIGCVSTHYDRSEKFSFSWKIGDLQSAVEEAEKLAETGVSRDRLLYQLEEGAIKRIQGDLKGSIFSFQKVAEEYDRWFGVHLKSEKRISEEFLSTLGSAEWKPYKSRIYERVMMRYYQALNYLQEGDKGRARAEIFKTRQSIEDSKQIWKKELVIAREQMKKKGVDLDKGLAVPNDPLRNELNRIKNFVPKNFPIFINPAALYLEALYFLRGGSQKDDFEKAAFSLKQLVSIYPDNQWILEDYKLAQSHVSDTEPTTYVFLETGRSPVRLEKRFDLPVMFFSATSRIPYLGISLPSLKFNDQYLKDLQVSSADNSTSFRTEILADFDLIVSQEFEKFYSLELSRAITGAVTKAGLQYITTNSVRGESETLRAVVGVSSGLLAQVTTRADLRSWSTLPKQIRFCKLPTPKDKKLTIQAIGTSFVEEISLKPAQTNLVILRSISSHVRPFVVGQISFDP
ncbi:MAG: hypothetical protein HN548_04390 [Opitutae bacterium]|nr:hypothetical protein [Opitutae bacterium]MBT5716941.1 hypothetical protein [Opitutae bacterium]